MTAYGVLHRNLSVHSGVDTGLEVENPPFVGSGGRFSSLPGVVQVLEITGSQPPPNTVYG